MPLPTTTRCPQDPGSGSSDVPASSAGPSAGSHQLEEGIGAGDRPGDTGKRGPWVPSTRLLVLCGLAVITAAVPFVVFDSVGIGLVDAPMHLRNQQGFYRNLSYGHWMPTWLDTHNAGFGALVFHIRGRGPHYLFSLFMWLLGGDAWAGLKFGTLAAFALGALLTYRLARMFFPPRVSLLAGMLHLLGPYLAFSLYAKFGICESVGLALAPWAIRRFLLLMERPSLRMLGWFAVSYALLIDAHLPVALVLGELLAVIAVFLAFSATNKRRFDGRRLAWAAGGMVLSLSLSAYYWVFMLLGGQADRMNEVMLSFTEDYQWFLFSREGWLIPTTAIPIIFIGVGFLALVVVCRSGFREALPAGLRRLWPALLTALSAGLLIQSGLARWVWENTPLSHCHDRTHRFDAALHLPVILLLVGSGGAIARAASTRWRGWLSAGWIGLTAGYVLLAVVIPWYVFLTAGHTVNSQPSTDPAGSEQLIYSPWTADFKQTLKRESSSDWKLAGDGVRNIHIERWAPEDKRFSFESDATTVDLRQYHYPGWRLEIDGKPVEVRPGKPYGQLQFDVGAGVHDGRLQLVWPPACRYGARVSIAALALTFGMIIPRPKSPKRQAFL